MPKAREHDPLALFSFALRESDWVLADLIACLLVLDEPSRRRVQRELAAASRRPGGPDSLTKLHRWAELSRGMAGADERD
jgi:hypothetical protein